MKTLQVALGERSYPIHIGSGLLGRADLLAGALPHKDLLVVSNETVAPLYLEPRLDSLAAYQAHSVILPDGEAHKNLTVLNTLFDALLEHRFGRDCALLALGGGVVGDITGFAAACYQRGVAYLQVPTTLLAQVDSSVGGKTAVNHPLGKNMIGAFHQPLCVIADTDTLHTLEERQIRAGIAEIIKYGLICDPDFLPWLEQNMDALTRRDADALAHAIERSCRIKARIVSADERESGSRALLNLGHTFGHAIETGLGYGRWLHGEAVAAGMCLAADLSARMGWITVQDSERVESLIGRAGLPCAAPAELEVERMLELMRVDKKAMAGRLRLVLLESPGRAVISTDFDHEALRETLRQRRNDEPSTRG